MSPLEVVVSISFGSKTKGTVDLDIGRGILDGRIRGNDFTGDHLKVLIISLLCKNQRRKCHLRVGRLGSDRHVGANVLDGLEGTDGLAELMPNLRVFNGHVAGGFRESRGIGGEQEQGPCVNGVLVDARPAGRPRRVQGCPLEA